MFLLISTFVFADQHLCFCLTNHVENTKDQFSCSSTQTILVAISCHQFQPEDMEHVSGLTRGYTGADLVELCQKALKIAQESSKENMVSCSKVLHRNNCSNLISHS